MTTGNRYDLFDVVELQHLYAAVYLYRLTAARPPAFIAELEREIGLALDARLVADGSQAA